MQSSSSTTPTPTTNTNTNDNEQLNIPELITSRPLHSKIFFSFTLASLSFTIYALFRVFKSTQLAQPLQSVKWQRGRMIGQAGIIGGLTGPLVWEGLGFDTWPLKRKSQQKNTSLSSSYSYYLLGLFSRSS